MRFEADGASVVLRREPWDCERLGLEAAKLEQLKAQSVDGAQQVLDAALTEARNRGCVHLSCRTDAKDRVGNLALPRRGFYLADTTVLLALETPPAAEAASPCIRLATAADADALAALSGAAFSDASSTYNRYINDPYLPRNRVHDVYAFWARTSIGGAAADETLVWLEEGRLLGFLTLVLPKASNEQVARVPLNAVAEHARGRGIYRALVVAGLHRAFAGGARRVEVRTQIQQLAVQRAWWRLGATAREYAHSWNCWLAPENR